MEKKIRNILIIFLVFTCSSIFGQKKRDILINKVVSVTETTEDVEDGQSPVKTDYTKFDATGEVSEEINYKSDGKFDNRVMYEYDSKGNKKKEKYFDAKGAIDYTVDIEYDNDGNKVRETYENAKGQKTKSIEYKYNNGLKMERTTLLPNGKVKTRKKYIYEFQK